MHSIEVLSAYVYDSMPQYVTAAVSTLLSYNFCCTESRGFVFVCAAFVADIYGVNQTQGPALNMSQASMLSGMYGSNPELLLDRVGAGIAEVTWQHALFAAVGSLWQLISGCCWVVSLSARGF